MAVARPMPDEAPVMRAMRSWRRPGMVDGCEMVAEDVRRFGSCRPMGVLWDGANYDLRVSRE
jgi:hypothetical protein